MRREQIFPGVALVALALGLGLGLGHVMARATAGSGGELVAGPAATFSIPVGSTPAASGPSGAADGDQDGELDGADLEGADLDGVTPIGGRPAPAAPVAPSAGGDVTPASRLTGPVPSTVPLAAVPSPAAVASGASAADPTSMVPVANPAPGSAPAAPGATRTSVTASSTTSRSTTSRPTTARSTTTRSTITRSTAVTTPKAAPTTATSVPSATLATVAPAAGLSRMEQGVLDAVNVARRANGCPALTVDPSLQAAAHAYAVLMVQQHWFDHNSPNGQSPTDRARVAGYRGGVGENLMMGFKDDPVAAVNDARYGWLQSEGHRRNILDCDYTRTGVGYDPGNIQAGYADGSWVQMFG